MNIVEFAERVLSIKFTPAEHFIMRRIKKLDDEYGAGRWQIVYGRKGNPRIIRRNKMEKKHRVYDPESESLLEMTIQDDGRITKIEEVRDEEKVVQ